MADDTRVGLLNNNSGATVTLYAPPEFGFPKCTLTVQAVGPTGAVTGQPTVLGDEGTCPIGKGTYRLTVAFKEGQDKRYFSIRSTVPKANGSGSKTITYTFPATKAANALKFGPVSQTEPDAIKLEINASREALTLSRTP